MVPPVIFRCGIFLAIGGGLAGILRAEEPSQATATPPPTAAAQAAPASSANPIVAAPGTPKPATVLPPAAPRRARAISPEVAAQLAAAAPKFTPPPPKPATPPPEEEEVDARELDKPKNGIIRLPKYIVREKPPAVLNERAVNTQRGLADLAMKRYVTEGYRALNRFTLPLFGSSAETYAMMRYEEEERLKTMGELNDMAGMVSARDRAAGAYVRKLGSEATMRQPDFDWRPIGR